MSEGLAGGDFCATRLPIRITVYYLAIKVKTFCESTKRNGSFAFMGVPRGSFDEKVLMG
jgi:hypothetical protein